MMKQDIDEEIRFFVVYKGLNKAPGPITLDLSLMTGGRAGTSIIFSTTPVRPFTNLPFFTPIPYEFLSVGSEKPTLTLSVNQIEAFCAKNCDDQINNAAVAQTSFATLEGATLRTGITTQTNRRLLTELA